jgi:hypothetical protein
MTKFDFLSSLIDDEVRKAAIGRALADDPVELKGKARRLALILALEINPHMDLSAEEHADLVGVTVKTLAKMRHEKRLAIPVNA